MLIDLTGVTSPYPAAAADLFRSCWRSATESNSEHSAPLYGLPELRGALGSLLGCPAEEIIVTGGARAAVPMLGKRLRRTVVECPTFGGVPALLTALGYEVVLAPWSEFASRPEPAAWLTSPARNPDGATLGAGDVETLRRNRWSTVVVNETYRWYAEPPAVGDAAWYFVGSMSKLFGPGARLGWIRGRRVDELEPHAAKISCPPVSIQATWSMFLAKCGYHLVAPGLRAWVSARDSFREAAGSALVEPERAVHGPFLLAALPEGSNVGSALDAFRRHGLLVGSGADFHSPLPAVRLCFTSVPVDRAAEAGRRFRRVLVDLVRRCGEPVA